MNYKPQTIKCFDENKIKNLYQTHCVEDNKKSLTINGESVKAKDLQAHYGDKPVAQVNTTFSKVETNTDLEEIKDEDMGSTSNSGHIEVLGDGTSKDSE